MAKKISLVHTSKEGRIGFQVDDMYYEYQLDTSYFPAVLKMNQSQPSEALNFVRKISPGMTKWAIADKALQCLASTAQSKEGNTMREKLANLAHEMWSEWMKCLFSKCIQPAYNGTLIIPAWAVNRWSRQMKTPYSELSEEEKESGRREADNMLECISVLNSHSYGKKVV